MGLLWRWRPCATATGIVLGGKPRLYWLAFSPGPELTEFGYKKERYDTECRDGTDHT